jgi:hypothetical protein
MFRRLLVVPALLVIAACAPSLIPGTQISDTEDHRAILDVLRRYKNAFEAKDAPAIAKLASRKYLDARESISGETLEKVMGETFEKVRDARLDINVRRIDVQGDRAVVDFFYASASLVDTPTAQWKRESDDYRMHLEREGKEWKVVLGF